MATTYTHVHPPIYYTVRSVVRWAFWTGLVSGVFATAGWASSTLMGHKEECPVRLSSDFTYVAVEPFTVGECEAPPYVVLYDGETWGWGG